MAKTASKSADFVVIDDLFPASTFALFWPFFRRQQFRHTHRDLVEHAWKPRDGNPLQGNTSVVRGKSVEGQSATIQPYPTGTLLDLVLDAVLAQGKRATHTVGTYKKDWSALLLSTFAYSQGMGLSWHSDELYPTYIYYLHPEWNAHWGGELLLMPAGPALPPQKMFDDPESNTKLARIGMGTFIAPRPNRLILLRRRIPHMIAPVSPSAGDHVRASATGCFMK